MPLSFLFAAQACDILYAVSSNPNTASLARSVYDVTPYITDIGRLSYLFNVIGLITAVPAVLTGGQQLWMMLQRQDVPAKLKNAASEPNDAVGKAKASASVASRSHPKLKVAFAHAALNDLVVAGAAYNWWAKSSSKAYAPTDLNVLISAVSAPLLGYAGFLGAKMVFDYGVGVDMRGAWSSKKEE
jgi:uncharacterized membrane protein